MATETHYFTGKCEYARLQSPDDKFADELHAPRYKINLYMEDEELDRFKKTGMQMRVKQSDKGDFVIFSRPEWKMIKNEKVEFGKPQVIDKNNNEFDGLVGNGSDVTIKVTAYDTRMGKGHRLEAVKINDLIEYEPEPTINTSAPTQPGMNF